jgi:hypothetical protein
MHDLHHVLKKETAVKEAMLETITASNTTQMNAGAELDRLKREMVRCVVECVQVCVSSSSLSSSPSFFVSFFLFVFVPSPFM